MPEISNVPSTVREEEATAPEPASASVPPLTTVPPV
jgi:hypothetical protein